MLLKECPFCSKNLTIKHNNFYKCKSCGVMFFKEAKQTTYEEDYFEKEYALQYGKPYLEDKANIQKKMKERVDLFKKVLFLNKDTLKAKKILEAGSASGYFLEIMQKEEADPLGWEISVKMAETANKNGFKTRAGDFHSLFQKWNENKEEPFDIVACFYVLEHFQNQKETWQALSRLIKPGGYLLLALPSFFGPLYRFHRSRWIQTHPKDHFADYSPNSLKKTGEKFGFKLVRKQAEGIHPDRFYFSSTGFMKKIFAFIQRKFIFSDTFFAILYKPVL